MMSNKNVYAVAFTVEQQDGKFFTCAHTPPLPVETHARMIDAYITSITSLLQEAAADGKDVSTILPRMIKLSEASKELFSGDRVVVRKK